MFAYLKGYVAEVTDENAIVEVNNIGYNVKVSPGTAAQLPAIGEEVKLYTYTCVREDAFLLYGFLTKDDLDIFRKIITVSGIGPKGGLGILSVMSADELRMAVVTGDGKAISKAPGIGAKTAQRLILDLKDKISMEDTLVNKEAAAYQDGGCSHERNEAIEALIALGYTSAEALRAMKKAEITEEMDSQQILKAVLKKIDF